MDTLKITLTSWALLICSFLAGQPLNDNCADAIPITVGTECTAGSYTSIGSTSEDASVAPNPSCSGYQGGDVWFTFQVPASGNFRVESDGNRWVLYTGSCGNFTQIACDPDVRNFSDPSLAGQTLYLRAYKTWSSEGADFTLCIWEQPVQPNDFCADAINLTVGQECTAQNFSSIYTTSEPVDVAPNPTSCNGYLGGDVWFSFDVPASGNFRIETSGTLWTLYSGTCGNFTQLRCDGDDHNFSEISLAGQTLYLRAYKSWSDQGSDFTVCIWEQPVQPNDFCADAINLTVGQGCNVQTYSSVYTTSEPVDVAPNPSCNGYLGGDVWFKFDVPASGNFRVEMSGTLWTLYSGTCGNFTQIRCEGNNHNFSDPSLAGQTLYLRAFRSWSDQGSDFTLCVWEQPVQPNDFCADAISLTVGQECTVQNFSSVYTTSEPIDVAANPSCGFYYGGDVWFTFEVPASGNFRVEMDGNEWALYSGTCGSFTEIRCEGNNHNFSDPSLAGQTLYLRAFRWNSDQGLDFTLCIWEQPTQPNDFCADAINIVVGQSCVVQNFSTLYTTAEPTDVAANPTCGFYYGGDVWFTFDVPASGDFRIEVDGNEWVLYSGSCGNFTQILCAGDSRNFSDPSLAGETLFLRTFRWNSDQGADFTLCIWEIDVPENNLCSNATNILLSDSCIVQSFTTRYSTAEDISVAENPSCGFYYGGDVWFTFTAPASGQFALNRTANSNGGTTQFAYYTGACGNYTEITCDGSSETSFNDPALGGELITVRAFSWNSRQGADFDMCIRNTTVAPNDNCADAIALTVGESCTFETFDSYNTTDEEGIAPEPGCGYYQGGDVWFTFEVPSTGQFQVNRNNLGSGSFNYALYTGVCGTFVEYDCSTNSTQSLFDAPELANQTVYLRVFRWNSQYGGEFELCIVAGDCNGDAGGTSFIDNCGDCVGGNTGLEACVQDCNGVYGGTAYLDNCATCVGGNTGLEECEQDCNGVYGGTAYIDGCEECVEGNTGLMPCSQDCNGEYGGTAYIDNCSTCVGGETGLEACVQDCNGEYGGTAYLDNCAICVGGTTGVEPCDADCNGVFGGSAFIDNCSTCVGGDTGLEACIADCNGDYGGTAFLDNCSTCVGGNTGQSPCIQDCNGEYGGTAYFDDCEECVGGSTGLEPCSFDCPTLLANIGDACDDNDPNTSNDTVTNDCECAGEGPVTENTALLCSDGIDNDGNGLIDCEDPACQELLNNLGCLTCFEDGSSFADSVIAYVPTCTQINPLATDPNSALGVPDYSGDHSQAVSLGRGYIKLAFTNNTLVNSGTEDPDLYVFEVGPLVEPSFIELRPLNPETELQLLAAGILDSDGDGYYEFGGIGGSLASVDIDAFFNGLPANSVFFDAIKIVDGAGDCSTNTPGADIDGVCALSNIACNIGEPCDDGDPTTINETLTVNCDCVGESIYDCPALAANIGDACDDNDATTENDEITANCECMGNPVIVFDCPELMANFGDACDDGDALTENDVVTADCECVGVIPAPINNNCSNAIALSCGDSVEGTSVGATNSGMVSPSCSGGSHEDVFYTLDVIEGQEYTVSINGADYDGVLVLYTGACGNLTELDCADEGFSGGVEESITFTAAATETLVIRTYDWSISQGSFTISAQCAQAFDCPSLGLNIGDDCDDANPATSGDVVTEDCECVGVVVPTTEVIPQHTPTNAQGSPHSYCDIVIAYNRPNAENFRWRFDGNGVFGDAEDIVYTRGFGNPAVRLSWVDGLVSGATYNVGVEVKVGGVWGGYSAIRPIDLAMTPNNVQIRPQFCGGTYGPNGVILSESICQADYYRFRLTPVGGGAPAYRTSGNYALILNGPLANLAPGDYYLDVKVSQGGQPGDFGPDCLITIGSAPSGLVGYVPAQRSVSAVSSDQPAVLYPNPSSGSEVRLELSNLDSENHEVSVIVTDMFGRQLAVDAFGHQGASLSRLIRFDNTLPAGMYLVQVVIDGELHETLRLVVN